MTSILALLLLSLVGGITSEFVDPFQPGPHEVSFHQFKAESIDGLEENLDIWTPLSPGKYPVLYYLDGFAMGTPGAAYSELLSHLATHGVVAIAPSMMLAGLTPEGKLPYFISVMEWAENNLEFYLYDEGVPQDVTLDFQTLLAGAHSAGSHVLVSYLKEHCGNFKGMQLSSPVDGADPLGLIPEYCITPGETLNFNIPTLHIAAGYDPVPGISGLACAPEKLSNERFWNAFHPESPRWSINATDFSHADLMDDPYRIAMEATHFCGFNEDITDDQYPVYRQFVAGTITAFFRALIDENCEEYLQFLEDPNLMLISASERHINPTGECPTLSCTWAPEEA